MILQTIRKILYILFFVSFYLISFLKVPFAGQLDFDTFRMLSVEMSEAEVLSRAGFPDTKEIVAQVTEKDGTISIVRQFSYIPGPEENDPQLTVITLKNGIITDIKRSPVFSSPYGNK